MQHNLQCSMCGHTWWDEEAKKIKAAAKVNGTGPFCNVCMHLVQASRYARCRGYNALSKALKRWVHWAQKQ